MQRLIKISFIMLIAVAVSSCAKDELESPHQEVQPNAVIMQDDEYETRRITPLLDTNAAEINDDGDDETAGPPPNGKDN